MFLSEMVEASLHRDDPLALGPHDDIVNICI